MHEEVPALAAAKAAVRRAVRSRRAARDDDERTRLAIGLRDVVLAAPALAGARTVACYTSSAAEPGTGPLRAALAAAGVVVLLPVVPHGSVPAPLDWAVDDGTLAPGALGTWQPTGAPLGAGALGQADVVLVPALAVDHRGHRLGQGGGYYDASLGRLVQGRLAQGRPVQGRLVQGPLVVALVHDDELLDADREPVPSGPLDQPVGAVATPSRWWDVVPLPPGGQMRS